MKEAINLQPETISLEKSEVLAGTLIHAGIINGQVEDVLLLPAIPNRIYVQSDDWKEPLTIVELCTTYPTKKSQIFPIIGTERNSAVYFGKEKIADIPFEIGLPPEDEKEDNTERQVEITVNTEIDFSMGVELNFLNGLKLDLPLKNIDSKFYFRPYSMEGIKLAAQGKPVPFNNSLADVFADVFNDLLGSGTKVSTSISLEEAARGCKRDIVFGRIEHCSTCNGTGKVNDSPCEVCAGHGTVLVGKTLEVVIPAGIDDGEIVRVPGMGNVSKNGCRDLLVTVYVLWHPVLKRQGDDIWCEVSITPEQAKNGTDVVVPTVDGNVSIKLQKGVQSGQTLRLKGKGICRPGKPEPGHQFVKVLIAPSQEEK